MQRKCTPNEFSKSLNLNKIYLDNSGSEGSKVRAIDFLKKVMKKSKAVWQQYRSSLTSLDRTACFPQHPEEPEVPAPIKELMDQEKEAVSAYQEKKPYKLRNGKMVTFSCIVLRE